MTAQSITVRLLAGEKLGNSLPRFAERRRSPFLWACVAVLSVLCGPAAVGQSLESVSQSAAEEIGALLQEKSTWTPVQAKLDSQLIYGIKKSRGEPFAPGAPNVQLDVTFKAGGRVLVDINATVTDALLSGIKKGGGQLINSFPELHAIRALVKLEQLETLAASSDVNWIRRADEAQTNTGSLDSQGDTTHAAIYARGTFGIGGAGVKVGVLSDSVDYYTTSQSTGDLGPLTILPGQSGIPGSGEGTAMLEIIHDLAPGADLYFATAFSGQASFAQNILNLWSNGCSVIVDDVGYFAESPFQDGVIAQAVNTFTCGGGCYFSSAANSGSKDANTSGTWEGDFVDGGPAAYPITAYEAGRLHNFGTTNYNTVLSGGSSRRVDLFWSDPLGHSTNDYDVFVLDSTGTTVQYFSLSAQTGTQDPYEAIGALSVGQRIVIVQYSGTGRFLHLSTGRARLNFNTAGATVGHSAATNAFSVAAVDAATGLGRVFTGGAANPVETFSSDGPRHVFYNADGTAMTPGNFSVSGGVIRAKPDITAADGVATTVPGFNPFYGTSAAAPHAAAIAALLKSSQPSITPVQLRNALTTSALDIAGAGWDRDSGYGLVMADRALTAMAPQSLSLAAAKTLSGNRFRFTLSGKVIAPVSILSSSNLVDWSSLATLSLSNNSVNYTDTTASVSRRYYKAKLTQ